MKKALACVCVLMIGVSAANAGTVFAMDLRTAPNNIISFPVGTPGYNLIGQCAIDSYAIDFDNSGTTLYAIEVLSSAPAGIGTINTTTGAYTQIAPVSGMTGSPGGLSCDPLTGTFYALATSGAGANNLYTVNPNTGAATLIGAMGGTTELFVDIAISPTGQMFAHDIASDSIYSVDKSTGATTLLGATGYACNYAQGMDFDYADGNLYATLYTGGGTGVFARIDLTTGAATPLLDTSSWNAEMEMAINSPIPEPASLTLLALAALALRRR